MLHIPVALYIYYLLKIVTEDLTVSENMPNKHNHKNIIYRAI